MTTAFLFSLADAATTPPSSLLNGIAVPMLAMGVIFYFLIIRPQNKRQNELKDRISSLKTGDKVVTNSGIHGIISNVKEGSTLLLKVADNVKIEINKDAIASVESNTPATVA
jgi:preprotein translocase subunit YajC